ncbi:MAG: transcription-repair coupling factor [Clostridia bacterium]|nr:transcription-repair coupling factor [Clostridia bacterium]
MPKGVVGISGISESRVAPVAANIDAKGEGQSLIVVSSEIRAKRLALDLSFFVEKNIYILPSESETLIRYEAKNHDSVLQRMKVLKALRSGEDCIVIAPAESAVKRLAPGRIFDENAIFFATGDEVDPGDIKNRLSRMGYERQAMIDGPGQFSVRGGIIDVFTPDAEYPYRIELFDTEIDSVRIFNPESQRSIENLRSVRIYPCVQLVREKEMFEAAAEKIEKEYGAQILKLERRLRSRLKKAAEESDNRSETDDEETEKLAKQIQTLTQRRDRLVEFAENETNLPLFENYLHYFYEKTEFIWDYMRNGQIMVDDPDRVCEALEVRSRELTEDFDLQVQRGFVIPRDFENYAGFEEFSGLYDGREAQGRKVYIFTPFQKKVKGVETFSELRSVISRQGIVFNGNMELFRQELKNYVRQNYTITIVCASSERIGNLREFLEHSQISGKIFFKIGELTQGMEFPEEKVCYIWDGDIFRNRRRSGKRRKKSAGQAISSFADMRKGDYVVHENHGIAKFQGIEQLTVQGVKRDYLKLKYAGEDVLYVPVEQMDIIQKYVGADGVVPKINRLSGGEWKKTKSKAKAAIAEMAQDLIELTAARQMTPGYAFEPDGEWQREFEDTFPYAETDDQLRSISEIKKDMEKPVAMDRLLCGDVGFGKTEVAARAMFKCVADGKQAAVLVPTTILANQHYYTLKERFEKFPFRVEVLSRFRSAKQQEVIVEKLKKGQIDLVIGTHRLLSEDVKFKDLGLLVIDEEQRFGVKHKEAIKQMRKNVDVLTLSATPIPRTLHMSMVGIRDMSLIEEPPLERYPVQTYVLEQDDELIKEALERELARGGQAFIVYNRVKGIRQVAEKIEELVPEANVAVGHGQMDEHSLENVMLSFINGETNVLVATTIVESGLDIPSANTMIVLDADCYGLSQLYQLRGRVGRSNKIAYTYLMYRKDKILSEVAEKRLRAIREFTEFGAGFRVAMKDLEIRGAGNLLGTAQSGHMMNIGYELYCKLVDDAVRALKGEIVNPDSEEALIEIGVTAYIPDRYISDEALKLQMYKKIAAIRNSGDEEEAVDELIDRFGEIPVETMNLLKVSRIRALAGKNCITRIYEAANKVMFEFAPDNPLKAESLARVIQNYGMKALYHSGKKSYLQILPKTKDKLTETVEVLELLAGDMI